MARNNNSRSSRRLLAKKAQTASASEVFGKNGNGARCELLASVCALIVRVVLVVPGGVTLAGLKAHDAPAGRPEQPKVTAELKPFWGVMVREVVAWPPEVVVREVGDAAKAKDGGSPII